MSADLTSAYDVYLGTWTDWSRGSVFGATLTLTRQNGSLLIAFLAFLVALVGTRFWRLSCLVLHFIYSKDSPSDAVHHQRQVFLRNAPNPESALWTLADMGFSWKRNAEKVWVRLLPLFGVATACVIGFTLASGFSSRVANLVGSEVLLSGANCAFLLNDHNMSTYGDTVGTQLTEAMIAAENYARQCYTQLPIGVNCGTYVQKQLLPAVLDTNASCPFDAKLCNSQTGNLFIDTGLLDSHHDFGRNAPPNQRLQWRRTLHCAPLAKEGYRFQTFDETKNQSYTTYYYGPLKNVNETTTVNYTAQFSNDVYPDIEELTRNSGDTWRDFSVRYAQSSFPSSFHFACKSLTGLARYHYSVFWNGTLLEDQSSFSPVPELNPQNASLFVFFLTSGRILFTHPTEDSWYGPTTNTTQIHKLKNSGWGNMTMFRQNEPGSPLACRELEEYCFTGVKGQQKCTSLQSKSDAVDRLFDLFDKGDEDRLSWLQLTTFQVAQPTKLPLVLLGTHVLKARNKLNGPLLGSLPGNQWQLEVQHWHSTNMAFLQANFLESVIGYKDPKYSHLLYYPNSTTDKEVCANQVRSNPTSPEITVSIDECA